MERSKSETYTVQEGEIVGKVHIKDGKLDWVNLYRESYRAYTVLALYSGEEISDFATVLYAIQDLMKGVPLCSPD